MVPALCAVLAQCPALTSLGVSMELVSEPFLAALERLDCAKSLRVLCVYGYVRQPRVRLARVLAALPALVELDGASSTFEAALSDEFAGLPGLRLLSLCCPSDFPPARSFWASLSGLRRLRVGLPVPLTAPCRQLLANLREAIPKLEALDINKRSLGILDDFDGLDLVALLDGAASALRELSVRGRCCIQAEFVAFVERSLAGLEKIHLGLKCRHDDGVSAMRAILKLPRLRWALLYCNGDRQRRVRLCASPRVERLRLAVPSPWMSPCLH